ncbi:uncharacterized protein PRCAT00003980001 [Priceomyces carsonii]|uniref:uncharacterized protein n=1 Tax=Priceomyces carsonii TaxID=28549 RepID=UPI002ED7A100|nr:unnamed protein product [Priceomyces carsonii]
MSYPFPSTYSGQYYTSTSSGRRKRRQRLFSKDIEALLYSLGDGPVCSDATINTVEDVLIEYLMDLSQKTLQHARAQGRSRIKLDDLPFALKDDPLKLARMEYILDQSARIEKAKKILDDDKTIYYSEDGVDNGDDDNVEKTEKHDQKKRRKKNTTTK